MVAQTIRLTMAACVARQVCQERGLTVQQDPTPGWVPASFWTSSWCAGRPPARPELPSSPPAGISGCVVESRPSRELYVERRVFSPRARTTKGRRKRRRKNLLTAPRKRGRPRKDASTTPPATKRHGRPRKSTSEAPKRRGRPPKHPLQAPGGKGRRGRQRKNTPAPSTGRRRPGRPRKNQVVAWIDPCAPGQDHGIVPWAWPRHERTIAMPSQTGRHAATFRMRVL